MKVWVVRLDILGDWDPTQKVFATEQGAKAWVAQYCREHWGCECGIWPEPAPAIPADDDEVIRLYYLAADDVETLFLAEMEVQA